MTNDLHFQWLDAVMAFLRAFGRIVSYTALIPVLKASSHKYGFTDLFVIAIFISINPSCRYPELALVRY